MWLIFYGLADNIHSRKYIGTYFLRIGYYDSFKNAGEHMIHFMFGEPVIKICVVGKTKGFLKAGFKTHFFLQPSQRCYSSIFPGQWVAAAGIGP